MVVIHGTKSSDIYVCYVAIYTVRKYISVKGGKKSCIYFIFFYKNIIYNLLDRMERK